MITRRPTTPDAIEQAIGGLKGVFWGVAGFSAIINLMMLAPSLYMLQVYDRVLPSRNQTTLLMLTLLILGAYALMGVLELLRSFVMIRISARLDVQASPRVYAAAFERAEPGDAVLLSPACASLDMFRNYGHRAEVFVAAVQALAEGSLQGQAA